MGRLTVKNGFSLVELMIAMALASIIAAAAITMLVSDSQTSRYQISQVETHTSGRFAFDFILADLRRAGYSENTVINKPVSGTGSASFATSDVLNITYDAALVGNKDCVGNAIVGTPTTNAVVNTYNVLQVNGVNTLMCNNTPLMAGVDGLQVLFGIDLNKDGTPDRYVEPGSEPANADIVTVQVAMLVASAQEGETLDQQYQLLNVNSGVLADRRARTLFTTTERIRNINMNQVL